MSSWSVLARCADHGLTKAFIGGVTRQTEIGTPGQIFIDGDSYGAASPRREIAVMTAQLPYTLINRSIHNHPPVAELLLTLLEGASPLIDLPDYEKNHNRRHNALPLSIRPTLERAVLGTWRQ